MRVGWISAGLVTYSDPPDPIGHITLFRLSVSLCPCLCVRVMRQICDFGLARLLRLDQDGLPSGTGRVLRPSPALPPAHLTAQVGTMQVR